LRSNSTLVPLYATARAGGGILTALLSHGAGQRHLWTEALYQSVPLLEGAHAALDPAEIQLCMVGLYSCVESSPPIPLERRLVSTLEPET
jgi:hypothetical protein